MKLMDIFEKYGHVRIAEQKDNQKILDFYNSIEMEGGRYKVRFVKEPDYFKFLNYEAANYKALYIENEDNEVEGMCSLTIRPCYLNGKIEHVGHFSDLRFKRRKLRKTSTSWKEIAGGFVREGKDVDELDKCNYYLGSYIEANIFAKKAIGTDKKAARQEPPKQEPAPELTPEQQKEALEQLAKAMAAMPFSVSNIASYQMISLTARKPLKMLGRKYASKSSMDLSVSVAEEKDLDELKGFLDGQNRRKAFGYIYQGEHDELERRFRVWDDFSISNFYLARDSSGKLAGCFAAWSPTKARRIVVDRFPRTLAILAVIAKIFGKKVPKKGDELEILYLTNLEIDHKLPADDKRYILNELIDAVYKSGIVKNYHILAFCDYSKENLSEGMEKDYLIEKSKTTLYHLHAPDAQNIVREAELEFPPGHEMVMT